MITTILKVFAYRAITQVLYCPTFLLIYMSRMSERTKEKISSNLLHFLYEEYPHGLSTNILAQNEVRDKEFVLSLLLKLEKKEIIHNLGHKKKTVWVMTERAYKTYKELL